VSDQESTTERRALDYWCTYADELIASVTSNNRLVRITRNPAVIGAFAEQSVRQITAAMVAPFRTSTGTISGPHLHGRTESGAHTNKQLDLIMWDPNPLPAVFAAGDFAVVPDISCAGVLEIKSSAYTDVGTKMRDTLDWVEDSAPGSSRMTPRWVSPQNMVIEPSIDPVWKALGVVCVRRTGQADGVLDDLIAAGRAVVLFEQQKDDSLIANRSHALHLVNFISRCRLRFGGEGPARGVAPEVLAVRQGEPVPGPLTRPS